MAHPWAGKIARKRNMEDKCRRANRPLTRAICHLFRFTSQTAYVPEHVGGNKPEQLKKIQICFNKINTIHKE